MLPTYFQAEDLVTLTKSEISTPISAHFSTKQWEPVLGEKIFFKKNVWQPDFRHSLPSCFSEREIEIIQESIKVELQWAQRMNICWRKASKFVQCLLKDSFIFVEYLFNNCRRRAFIFFQYLFKNFEGELQDPLWLPRQASWSQLPVLCVKVIGSSAKVNLLFWKFYQRNP